MKKILCVLLALVLLCGAALADGAAFSTTDTDGAAITEAIFADYDLTMVNIWATWCGYCIEEMPAFPALKERLPENVNLITVCEDAAAEPELTAQILEYAGANFTTLVGTAELFTTLLSGVYAFPTTLFFDRSGNPVGEAVVGVPSLDDPAGAYYEIAMERLEMVG